MAGLLYRLSMPEPALHLFRVELHVPDPAAATELVMPSWTPGSYLLREFARNVQDFEAECGGAPATWTKTNKNTWLVACSGGEELVVRYAVYANELTVRTSHLDATHGYVNGASVFMYARGRESHPLEVEVEAPAGWRTTTALPRLEDHRFLAASYDELVDSPMEIGTHELLEWEQEGKPHRYAIWGRGGYDAVRLVEDTKRIVAAESALFGGLPYPEYTFILHLVPEGRGGLEHRASSSLQAERWSFDGEKYEDFLALVAHEFFHVWNAKRIRPEPLGPFDYTAENYTRNLWVVEGLTTYYTDLMLRRAGILSEQHYLERLAASITRLEALPGRRRQSLADSSFDTWIRFYRPDENTPNSQVSYYHKGALVGLLLDLQIRRATEGARSLDDVMRALWTRYGARDVGYPEAGEGGVEAIAEEVAGAPLGEFFDRYVRGTEELEFAPALASVGVRLEREPTPDSEHAAALEARLGVRTRERAGRLEVSAVLHGGPGSAAGLAAGDEIVALERLRCSTAAQLAARLRGLADGAGVEIAVFRRDELVETTLRLGPPARRVKLVPDAAAGPRAEALRAGWLGGGHLDPGEARV